MVASVGNPVRTHLERLSDRLNVPSAAACAVFDALATAPLEGPHVLDGRRVSGLQRDGLPFEWSVSVGPTPGGLRMLVDCGTAGASTTVRVRQSLRLLSSLLDQLGVTPAVAAGYESLIRELCPPAELVNESLIGVWIGTTIDARGRVAFKICVNQEFGSPESRYVRTAHCLLRLGRVQAFGRLRSFASQMGDRIVPRLSAVELVDDHVGRVKLYLRTVDGTPQFISRVAKAAGVEAPERLEAMHDALLGESPAQLDPRVVSLALEFAERVEWTGFKVDLNALRLFPSDSAAHERCLDLLKVLGYAPDEYLALQEVCAPSLSDSRVESFTWVGTALRGPEQRVNVYFHPGQAIVSDSMDDARNSVAVAGASRAS